MKSQGVLQPPEYNVKSNWQWAISKGDIKKMKSRGVLQPPEYNLKSNWQWAITKEDIKNEKSGRFATAQVNSEGQFENLHRN